MKSKYFLIVLLLSYFTTSIFAVGVIDPTRDNSETDSEFVYFISSKTPSITIDILSPNENLVVTGARLTYADLVNTSFFETPIEIQAGQEQELTFSLQNFGVDRIQNEGDELFFELLTHVEGGSEELPVLDKSDPYNYVIKLDQTAPGMDYNRMGVLPSISYYEEDISSMFFNENLLSYRIFMEGELISEEYFDMEERSLSNALKSGGVDLSSYGLEDNFIQMNIELKDLAENTVNISLLVFPIGEPFEINLLNRNDDSSLSYHYDKTYNTLFNGTIFSETNNFILKIETNKQSNCYLSEIDFPEEFNGNVIESTKQNFTTIDNKLHTFNVDLTSMGDSVFIACENEFFPDQIITLGQSLNLNKNKVFYLKKYGGSDLRIDSLVPNSLVTSPDILIMTTTNERAVCTYTFDNLEEKNFENSNFKDHRSGYYSVQDGSYDLSVNCMDVLANSVSKSVSLNVDLSQGIRVTDFSPKYVASLPETIIFSTSDALRRDCRVNVGTRITGTSVFNSLPVLEGEGNNYVFTLTGVQEGVVPVYVYCKVGSQLFNSSFNVPYEKGGPKITAVNFLNENGIKSSTYTSSTEEIKLEIETESLIPVRSFKIEVIGINETYEKEFSSNKPTLKGDFSGGVPQLKITPINQLGVLGAIFSKQIKFDLLPPQLSFILNSGTFSLKCEDSTSSCVKILYGFGSNPITCDPSVSYGNSSPSYGQSPYICATAYDEGGNEVIPPVIISTGIVAPMDKSLSNTSQTDRGTLDSQTDNEEESRSGQNSTQVDTSQDDTSEDDPLDDPYVPDTGSDSQAEENVNIYVVIAMFLLLGTLSGSAYYVYRRGYLDNQLKQLGILDQNVSHNSNSYYEPAKQEFSSSKSKNYFGSGSRKSSYDRHLDRLNKFLEEAIHKKDEVFDSFSSKTKDDANSFKSSITSSKKRESSKNSQDDEFSVVSQKREASLSKSSVKDDAKSFEDYHKNQKGEVKEEVSANVQENKDLGRFDKYYIDKRKSSRRKSSHIDSRKIDEELEKFQRYHEGQKAEKKGENGKASTDEKDFKEK